MERLQEHRLSQKGFTFVEILIVLAVLAILAVIAIYQFAAFRERAVRSGMQQDARNVATMLEAYHIDHQTYPDFSAKFDEPYVLDSQIVRPSPNNFVLVQGGSSYRIIVNNPGGGGGSQNCSLVSQGDTGWY